MVVSVMGKNMDVFVDLVYEINDCLFVCEMDMLLVIGE